VFGVVSSTPPGTRRSGGVHPMVRLCARSHPIDRRGSIPVVMATQLQTQRQPSSFEHFWMICEARAIGHCGSSWRTTGRQTSSAGGPGLFRLTSFPGAAGAWSVAVRPCSRGRASRVCNQLRSTPSSGARSRNGGTRSSRTNVSPGRSAPTSPVSMRSSRARNDAMHSSHATALCLPRKYPASDAPSARHVPRSGVSGSRVAPDCGTSPRQVAFQRSRYAARSSSANPGPSFHSVLVAPRRSFPHPASGRDSRGAATGGVSGRGSRASAATRRR